MNALLAGHENMPLPHSVQPTGLYHDTLLDILERNMTHFHLIVVIASEMRIFPTSHKLPFTDCLTVPCLNSQEWLRRRYGKKRRV